LLGDPLLSELPLECSGKNRSPFPHAKRMGQKEYVDVGREKGASIPWQRIKRMSRVEDFTSPLKSHDLDMVGVDLCTPRQGHTTELESFQKCLTRKYLPLTHFFGEEDVGHAPASTSQADLKPDVSGNAELEDFEPSQKTLNFKHLPLIHASDEEHLGIYEHDRADLNSDMSGKAELEETLKVQSVDTVGGDLYVPFQEHEVDMAFFINVDALDLDLQDSLRKDVTGTDLRSSLDFDVSMDEGRHCDISYPDSVYDCTAVHGDHLLGDPLLSELPSEYIGKNKSPFPHAKQMCQKQGQDVGRQQGASILGRRRSLRVEDSTSQAELKWNLFGKAEVEETLKAQKVGRNLYTPLHEIWKDLPLSHSFDEDDVGLCAPDSDLKLDVFGKAEDEESLKVQNVDTVGGDPYASLQRHVAVMESFEKSLTKKDLPVLQSCDSEGLKIHVLAGPPVLALRRKRPWA